MMADFSQILLFRLLGTSCRKKNLAEALVYWRQEENCISFATLYHPLWVRFLEPQNSSEVGRWETLRDTMDVKPSVIWSGMRTAHASGSRAWGTWWDRHEDMGCPSPCCVDIPAMIERDQGTQGQVQTLRSQKLKNRELGHSHHPSDNLSIFDDFPWDLDRFYTFSYSIHFHLGSPFRLPTCCAFVAGQGARPCRGPRSTRAPGCQDVPPKFGIVTVSKKRCLKGDTLTHFPSHHFVDIYSIYFNLLYLYEVTKFRGLVSGDVFACFGLGLEKHHLWGEDGCLFQWPLDHFCAEVHHHQMLTSPKMRHCQRRRPDWYVIDMSLPSLKLTAPSYGWLEDLFPFAKSRIFRGRPVGSTACRYARLRVPTSGREKSFEAYSHRVDQRKYKTYFGSQTWQP